ncbi:hybrid sensor histidine kinase/response regulator [Palleronia caenipelagi]|uniref:histidine kinase n=1 Tax=Palleronia caenipelagi TaxID=2489174 RepID=A0A547PJ36_9RHOB|nr:ATP-binding protein [Palleronia caenipelagi]TRD14139.1 response regulator [Palleronia caenipelagi]
MLLSRARKILNFSAESWFVLRNVALLAVVLTLVVSALQIFNMSQLYSAQQRNLQHLQTEFLKMISYDLGRYNLGSLELDVKVLTRLETFRSARIVDRFGNELYNVHSDTPPRYPPLEIDKVLYGTDGEYAGQAKIVLDAPSLMHEAKRTLSLGLLVFALTFAPVALLFARFMRTYVTNPLSDLQQACGTSMVEGDHVPVTGKFSGHFASFIHAFNEMQCEKKTRDEQNRLLVKKLNQKQSELQVLNQELVETASARAKEALRRRIESEALDNVLSEADITLKIVQNGTLFERSRFGAPCPEQCLEVMSLPDFSLLRVRDAIEHAKCQIVAQAITRETAEDSSEEAEQGYDLTVSSIRTGRFWVVSRVPLHNDAEALIVRDITSLTNAEIQLRQAQKMDALGVLASGVAHDFNNVLTIIFAALENIRQSAPLDVHHDVDIAIGASERAARVVRQLLKYSSITPSNQDVISPAEKLDEIAPLLRATLGPGISCQINVETRQSVTCDSELIDGAVLNLATNAAHAMKGEGHIDITLRGARLDEIREVCALHANNSMSSQDEFVVLAISDNGDGVAPELVDRIFEPFFTTKSRGAGTGLGLAMVFGMCGRAGGALLYEKNEPRGAIFKLILPKAHEERSQRSKKIEDQKLPLDGHRLLIIDDEELILDVQERLFSGAGAQVLTCSNKIDFLDLVITGRINDQTAVLSDYTMSGWNGSDVSRVLAEHKIDVDFFIVTGNPEMIDRELMAGHYGIIQKPFSLSDIVEALFFKSCIR